MKALRYLCRSVNLLNILLLAGLTVLILYVVLPLFRVGVKYRVPSIKEKTIMQEEGDREKAQTPPSPLDYVAISESNLFHPERRIPPEKKDEKALPKPELVLYGTVVSDGMTIAYIEDKKSPKTTPGRGKRQTVVKKGDVLSGFTLREIQVDRITLTRDQETMVVPLMDVAKQRGDDAAGGSKPPSPATQAVSASPAPLSAPASPGRLPVLSGRPADPTQGAGSFIRRGLRPGSRDPRKGG